MVNYFVCAGKVPRCSSRLRHTVSGHPENEACLVKNCRPGTHDKSDLRTSPGKSKQEEREDDKEHEIDDPEEEANQAVVFPFEYLSVLPSPPPETYCNFFTKRALIAKKIRSHGFFFTNSCTYGNCATCILSSCELINC